MTRFEILNRLLNRFGYELASNNTNTPTGADAVVVDYHERQELSERSKEITATWDSVERIADDGYFNSVTLANVTFDLGDYGKATYTFHLEDELPVWLDDLNLSVEDLPKLVDESVPIPMIRMGGEWKIDFATIDEWDQYTENEA